MSFYGSLYYQAGEAFAKILLDNYGAKYKDVSFMSEEPENSEILAKSRKGEMTLKTGNRWITLEGESGNNVCTIRHNAPDGSEENLKTYIMPIQKAEAPAEGIPVNEMPLTDDIYFISPAVYYDEAGHIIPTGNVTYFKIPKIAIQASIDEIAAGLSNLETNVNEQKDMLLNTTSTANNARNRVSALEDLVGYQAALGVDDPIADIIGNIEDMRSTIDASGQNGLGSTSLANYLAQAYTLIDKIDSTTGTLGISNTNINNDLAALRTEVNSLKARIEALENT